MKKPSQNRILTVVDNYLDTVHMSKVMKAKGWDRSQARYHLVVWLSSTGVTLNEYLETV